ncbi:hypothetical protein CEUSTIGMA_g8592.t1 [Chlamydomonas eustigma]|uniref:Anaphase-promoting complex subunit 4-like WD40 domain-containing protein n=1 Tax=Chlamydomonas eustigma TaxID=1157962 RepID=A0A250XE23_9CHLO|nr:hypothetical protein CEUSTIGMA_g8592.t1 [Chlamydomonas eustigma]|eukprot:GAX81159.1 hypothetical protein CEUSTIGMA_g8592.t1 [Chlamydomonas eustigma]
MYSEDEDEEQAMLVTKLFSIKVPPQNLRGRSQNPSNAPRASVVQPKPGQKPKPPALTVVAFDASKRRLYYGLDNGETSFWTVDSIGGAGTSRYVGLHQGPVSAILPPQPEEGPLGKAGLLITGSVTGNIKIWDYQGKVLQDPTVLVQTLYGHSSTITGLFVYGNFILSCSTDKSIRLWRLMEGRENLAYPWFELQSTIATLDGWVRSMSYGNSGSPGDHGVFYAVSDVGTIVRILPDEVVHDDGSILSKTQLFTLADAPGINKDSEKSALANVPHDRGVLKIHYVGHWQLLFTLSYDHCIRCYDIVTGSMIHQWENENRCHFTWIEVDTEFSEVLAVDVLGYLSIFSTKTGFLFATKRLCKEPILSIAHALGRQRYVVSTAREVTFWEVNHELEYNVLRGGHDKAIVSLYACSGGAGAVEGERDFRIFSASIDNTVRLWDPFDLCCVRVMGGNDVVNSEISAMTFYEAWRILVTGHDNGEIRLWDVESGQTTFTLRQHSNTVSCMSMTMVRRNEELLVTGGYDGYVCIWDIRNLRGREPPHMVSRFKAHGPGSGETAGANISRLMSTAFSGQLSPFIHDSPSHQQHSATSRATTPATPIGLSTQTSTGNRGRPKFVMSPSGRGMLAPWQAASMTGHEPEVLAVRYDASKKAVFTAGNNGSIRVWSIHGYILKGKHEGHSAPVTCLAMDANFLFSGSDDHTICVWDAVPAATTGYGAVSSSGGVAVSISGRITNSGIMQPMSPHSKRWLHTSLTLNASSLSDVTEEASAQLTTATASVIASASSPFAAASYTAVSAVDPISPDAHGSAGMIARTEADLHFGGYAVDPFAAAQDFSSPAYVPFVTAPLKVLKGHTSSITGLEVLTGCAGQIMSCSLDGTLRFWNYVTGDQLHRYTHHEEIRCLALRADRAEVLVGTNQASILRFPLPAKVLQKDVVDHETEGTVSQEAAGKTYQQEMQANHKSVPKAAVIPSRVPGAIAPEGGITPTTNASSRNSSLSSSSVPAKAGAAAQPIRSAIGKKPAERVGLFNTKLTVPSSQANKTLSSASSESSTYYGYYGST